jgi:ankyrin repeat protein
MMLPILTRYDPLNALTTFCRYQGTWINYRRGREFCRQYGVEELLRPLLDYDISTDGSGQPGQGMETPTKEQAMAANRKRLYTQSMDGRPSQGSSGTFFSNISSTASTALAAMNKAARLNSPAPHPGNQPRRPGTVPPRSSQSMVGSQESFRANSQQSMPSLASQRSFDGSQDSTYATQSAAMHVEQFDGNQEPPRKRLKPSSPGGSFSQPNGVVAVFNEYSQREGTPTEPNESFLYQQAADQLTKWGDGDIPIALPPLPHPGDRATEEKQSLLLDLFADPNRTDFSNHPAITQLSGQELDLPLDQSANTALHWAATLARVSLIRLLISKGASIFRGNIAGETPLMSAVQVNNNLDHSCFPELLEIFGPLIEVQDAKSRTILHHIAVASGVKGRAASSKYYLEALLEFLVRSNSNPIGTTSSFDGSSQSNTKPIGLMRFMSEMVNARDMTGSTALMIVARLGNRSIIQQLLEVQADPTIPNHKGLRPVDFGVGGDAISSSQQHASRAISDSPSRSKGPTSKIEEWSRDIQSGKNHSNDSLSEEYQRRSITNHLEAIASSFSDTQSQFNAELRTLQDRIDTHNAAIKDLHTTQTQLASQLDRVHSTIRARQERKQKLHNLRRVVGEMKARLAKTNPTLATSGAEELRNVKVGDADKEFAVPDTDTNTISSPEQQNTPSLPTPTHSQSHQSRSPTQHQPQQNIPPTSPQTLQRRLSAYTALNVRLAAHLKTLRARDSDLEAKMRKVIALCTGVAEEDVDRLLPQLCQAVESEGEGIGTTARDVGRVREFLRKVDEVVS